MTLIAIAYHSGYGHTLRQAQSVAAGAGSVAGAEAKLFAVDTLTESDWAELASASAIIFGSPTYMGGPSAQFKAFADATGGRWYGGAWRDKVAAGFTVSMGPSGDKLSTLHYFFTLAMQHGMIWIGQAETPMNDKGINRLSSYSGVMAQAGQEPPETAPNEADKLTGEVFGKRVAEFTLKLKK